MTKRIVKVLCTAVLTLGLTAIPVMASDGPLRPTEVESYTYGPLDELRISKVYELSQHDDPSGIPTEDFVYGNRRYYLLDMTTDNTDGEVVTYTVIFGSEEFTRDEKYAESSSQTGLQTLYADFAEKDNDLDLLPVLGCAGGVVIVAAIGFLICHLPRNKGSGICV